MHPLSPIFLGCLFLSSVVLAHLLSAAPGVSAPKKDGQAVRRALLSVSVSSRPMADLPEAREKADLLALLNQERTTRGLGTLTEDLLLSRAAHAHSEEMATRDYFDHHSPTPGLATPMNRYLANLHESGGATPNALRIGENLYYCSLFNSIYTVDYGHRALMASPEHRANILDRCFTKIGLGLYHDSKGGFWMTEMFLGNPKSAH